jgi:DNA-directed RNA polymerase specialized sigma24 family protein
MSMTDENLLKRYLSGDNKAFERLFLKYNEILVREAYRIIGSADAESVAQDTWETFIEKAQSIKNGNRLRSWLVVVTHNIALNVYNHRKRYATNILSSHCGGNLYLKDELMLELDDSSFELVHEILIKTIDNIKHNDKPLIYDYIFSDYQSCDLLAVKHDLSVSNAKVRVHRFKAQLMDSLNL